MFLIDPMKYIYFKTCSDMGHVLQMQTITPLPPQKPQRIINSQMLKLIHSFKLLYAKLIFILKCSILRFLLKKRKYFAI